MEYTIDAQNKSLGRVASEAAALLNGKNSTDFAKNVVADVKVTIINASLVKVTGDKMSTSTHKRYSGYPSGLKEPNLKQVAAKKGYSEIVKHAVYGMLPKNKLQDPRFKNLIVTE
jgi:large subunit ribosomal protein L13